ncbi:MAG TPA: hypothetical protein VLA46_14025, partial [Saprospiraceae bacterium]|nr:hypothetical protein [Saprospiraceae bacterium]
MKKFLFTLYTRVTLSILISSFCFGGILSSQAIVPLVTVRFANPDWNATTSQYCVDVEFLSDTSDIQVFGMNVRFFYDDSVLEFVGFDDFQGGYAAFAPNPPHINTSPAGPALFGFSGPADFVNGAIQLVTIDSTPVILDTVQWTKIFRVCFDIDDADPNAESFCPSLVWDMEANPANGGFLVADDGAVITVLDPDPAYESAPSVEHVVQFNWRYIGTGSTPWGEPIEEVCIPLGMPLTLSAPLNLSLGCMDSTDPSVTGFATATDACEGDIIITYSDEIVYGVCSQDFLLTRTWTASNGCSELGSVDQEIEVTDSTIPILTVPEYITISCVTHTSPNITGMASAIDNCGQEPMVFIEGDSVAEQLCTNQLVIIRTFVAVDPCGNIASHAQRITVKDTIPPTFSIPTYSWLNQLIAESSTLMYLSDTGMIGQLNTLNENSILGVDQCDDQIIPSFSVSNSFAENCATEGYFERRIYSWSMTDECGNSAEEQYTVDIMDDVAPVLTGVPGDAQVFCEQLPSIPHVYSDDPAQPVTILFSEVIAETDQPGIYDVYRHWSGTDACGNVIVAVQHITWRPASLLTCTIGVPKKVDCHSDKVVLKSTVIGDQEEVTYLWELIGEGSYIKNGQGTPRLLIHTGEAPVYVILTLTDQYGCTAVCTAWIDCGDSAPLFVEGRSTIDVSDGISTMILLDEAP